MRFICTLVFLFCVRLISAQSFVQQFDGHVDDVFVRTDTAYQWLVREMDIPADGFVVASIDGVCTVTPGDVITLAVSKYTNWSPNYGNISVKNFDTTTIVHAFQHTMMYDVKKGKHSFYALAHNWTDRQGTGFTSVTGTMTLWYVAATDTIPDAVFHQLNIYPLVLNETVTDIDTLTVEVTEPSSILLSYDGRLYSTPGDEIEITWFQTGETDAFHSFYTQHASHKKVPGVTARTMIRVTPGTHHFVMKAKKIIGNMTTTNNAFYGTFSAMVFPDSDETRSIQGEPFSGTAGPDEETSLGQWDIDIPAAGQLLVLWDGYGTLQKSDTLDVAIHVSGNQAAEKASAPAWTTLDMEKYGFFTGKHLIDVEPGQVSLSISGRVKGGSGSHPVSQINGSVTFIFIADPVVSSVFSFPERAEKEIIVYPNPANDFIQWQSREETDISDRVSIVNSLGQVVAMTVAKNNRLSVSDLQPGVYRIRFVTPEGPVFVPFIKL